MKIRYTRTCPDCGGDGRGDCPNCGGSGYDGFSQCSRCGGTGEGDRCPTCGGSGQIIVDEEEQ